VPAAPLRRTEAALQGRPRAQSRTGTQNRTEARNSTGTQSPPAQHAGGTKEDPLPDRATERVGGSGGAQPAVAGRLRVGVAGGGGHEAAHGRARRGGGRAGRPYSSAGVHDAAAPERRADVAQGSLPGDGGGTEPPLRPRPRHHRPQGYSALSYGEHPLRRDRVRDGSGGSGGGQLHGPAGLRGTGLARLAAGRSEDQFLALAAGPLPQPPGLAPALATGSGHGHWPDADLQQR